MVLSAELLRQRPRQASILNRLRQMPGGDLIASLQVRDAACDAQHPMVAPRGEVQGLGGAAEQAGAHRIERAKLVEQIALKLRVAHLLALPLAFNGLGNACAPVGGVLALCRLLQGAHRQGGHLHLEVDAVQQRSGEPAAVLADLRRGAAAYPLRITEVAAGAGIHRRDQLKTGRKSGSPRRPGDMDFAGFQRLPQYLQYRTGELGHFVQEKDAVVRQTDFAGARV